MVDVGSKADTERVAVAAGRITMEPATLALVASGTAKKGDVLGTARLAGIMASKRTAELVPLCHPLPITHVAVELRCVAAKGVAGNEASVPAHVACEATVRTVGKTGVEMEALMAVQVALLTVYDMCKAVDRGMVIDAVQVLEKRGGKSGDWPGRPV